MTLAQCGKSLKSKDVEQPNESDTTDAAHLAHGHDAAAQTWKMLFDIFTFQTFTALRCHF